MVFKSTGLNSQFVQTTLHLLILLLCSMVNSDIKSPIVLLTAGKNKSLISENLDLKLANV